MLHETENNAYSVELVAFAGLFSFHIHNGTLNKSNETFTATILYQQCSATVYENEWLNIPYPTAFPYGNGMVLHFYQQQESSTTKTVHKVINKGLKAYV